MKKNIIIALCVILCTMSCLLSFAGCSKEGDDPDKQSGT